MTEHKPGKGEANPELTGTSPQNKEAREREGAEERERELLSLCDEWQRIRDDTDIEDGEKEEKLWAFAQQIGFEKHEMKDGLGLSFFKREIRPDRKELVVFPPVYRDWSSSATRYFDIPYYDETGLGYWVRITKLKWPGRLVFEKSPEGGKDGGPTFPKTGEVFNFYFYGGREEREKPVEERRQPRKRIKGEDYFLSEERLGSIEFINTTLAINRQKREWEAAEAKKPSPEEVRLRVREEEKRKADILKTQAQQLRQRAENLEKELGVLYDSNEDLTIDCGRLNEQNDALQDKARRLAKEVGEIMGQTRPEMFGGKTLMELRRKIDGLFAGKREKIQTEPANLAQAGGRAQRPLRQLYRFRPEETKKSWRREIDTVQDFTAYVEQLEQDVNALEKESGNFREKKERYELSLKDSREQNKIWREKINAIMDGIIKIMSEAKPTIFGARTLANLRRQVETFLEQHKV